MYEDYEFYHCDDYSPYDDEKPIYPAYSRDYIEAEIYEKHYSYDTLVHALANALYLREVSGLR